MTVQRRGPGGQGQAQRRLDASVVRTGGDAAHTCACVLFSLYASPVVVVVYVSSLARSPYWWEGKEKKKIIFSYHFKP